MECKARKIVKEIVDDMMDRLLSKIDSIVLVCREEEGKLSCRLIDEEDVRRWR